MVHPPFPSTSSLFWPSTLFYLEKVSPRQAELFVFLTYVCCFPPVWVYHRQKGRAPSCSCPEALSHPLSPFLPAQILFLYACSSFSSYNLASSSSFWKIPGLVLLPPLDSISIHFSWREGIPLPWVISPTLPTPRPLPPLTTIWNLLEPRLWNSWLPGKNWLLLRRDNAHILPSLLGSLCHHTNLGPPYSLSSTLKPSTEEGPWEKQ